MKRAATVGVIAASLLGSCTGGRAGTSPRASIPGVAPTRFAVGVYGCPADHYVPVFGRYVYGVEYPKPPSGAKPDRCFTAEQEARAAGFSTPPPPPGYAVVDGVYLEPTPPFVLDRCLRAVRKAGIPVPCPRLIPAQATPQQYVARGQFVMEIQGFLTPPRYPQRTPQGFDLPRHMFVMAARPALARYVTSCTGARTVGTERLHAVRARWVRCPEGSEMNSGHIVLAWHQGGVDYAVSIHGDYRTTRDVCLAVARGVRVSAAD